MKLEIVQIVDRGVANKERLHLRVTADANLSFYIVFASSFISPSSISSHQRAAYWFTPKAVKAGDNVILYTGLGIQTESKDGMSTNHFLYWGLPTTLWRNAGECAVLFEINTWQTSRYE